MSRRTSLHDLSIPLMMMFFAVAFLGVTSCRLTGFSHKEHLSKKVSCETCHGEDRSEPRLPRAADCAECHGEAKKYDKKAFTWGKPASYGDSKFSHSVHAGAEIACSACHEATAPAGDMMSVPRMDECVECHEKEGVDGSCETCHSEIREGEKPYFHTVGFLKEHGRWDREGRGYCSSCHGKDGCVKCHSRMKPASHIGAWGQSAHGVMAAQDRENCAVCHEAAFCTRCHSLPPPSHSISNFKFGGHELPARKNSRACLTCHPRSFCARCH